MYMSVRKIVNIVYVCRDTKLMGKRALECNTQNSWKISYCIQTLTRHLWIHYTDCWIIK